MNKENSKIEEIDYFGINEINICVTFNGQKYRGCLSEVED